MPTDPKKRQKKQERRAAKRKAKHHQLVRQSQAGLAERLAAADKDPILQSWATQDVWSQGLGQVCLSRELPNGSVAFALFLVDRYCLGVKDAFGNIEDRSTYDREIERKTRSRFAVKDLPPAAVRKLVEGAVAYARRLGLQPHPDYHKAKPIFGTIDPAEWKEEFEFGKDGKPFFVAGPHDSPARCRQVLRALEQAVGPGEFHCLIPLVEGKGVLAEGPPEEENFDLDELESVWDEDVDQPES